MRPGERYSKRWLPKDWSISFLPRLSISALTSTRAPWRSVNSCSDCCVNTATCMFGSREPIVYGSWRPAMLGGDQRSHAGRRLEAIRKHPRVSMSVTQTGPGAGDWTSVLVVGDARILGDRSVANRYVALIVAKYRAAYGVMDRMPEWMLDPSAYVVQIDPIEMSGRAAGDTRPGRIEIPPRT